MNFPSIGQRSRCKTLQLTAGWTPIEWNSHRWCWTSRCQGCCKQSTCKMILMLIVPIFLWRFPDFIMWQIKLEWLLTPGIAQGDSLAVVDWLVPTTMCSGSSNFLLDLWGAMEEWRQVTGGFVNCQLPSILSPGLEGKWQGTSHLTSSLNLPSRS
jgi:hypothetical protein